MSVDKNLFLYDLAVVAIMKNESPYIKEWLDYHLLAGVNHFYIYDNESEDNFKEVLKPYIDAGLVTYIFYPGKVRQKPAFNAAVRDFKFNCRYMTFIDADEFIFPHSKPTIIEVVDDVLADNSKAAALGINWRLFGSNGQEKADYTRGVLERFTARDAEVNIQIKTIADPRTINFIDNPHSAVYFNNFHSVNEHGKPFAGPFNEEKTADKISINHYYTKSREEYAKKVQRGRSDIIIPRTMEEFSDNDKNDIQDDGILKYRDERLKLLVPEGSDIVEIFSEINQVDFDRLLKAVTSNLLPTFEEEGIKKFFDNPTNRFEYFDMLIKFLNEAPQDLFKGKIETFLNCLAVSTYLKETFIDEELGNLFEEFALYSIYKSLFSTFSIYELKLLIKELPRIFSLQYPIVEKIRAKCLRGISDFRDMHSVFNVGSWKDFVHLDYLINMLRVFDNYNHK